MHERHMTCMHVSGLGGAGVLGVFGFVWFGFGSGVVIHSHLASSRGVREEAREPLKHDGGHAYEDVAAMLKRRGVITAREKKRLALEKEERGKGERKEHEAVVEKMRKGETPIKHGRARKEGGRGVFCVEDRFC